MPTHDYRRSVSKQQLGPRFDIRAFHDEILDGGSLPLDMLEARVDNWIESQLRTAMVDERAESPAPRNPPATLLMIPRGSNQPKPSICHPR
jgi:hypothetical protein